ncbi:MAG: hypothetical protein M0R46_14470 [Candidatus Muirbacterium halophilum]|nr:hypothetical protein [Candidatus Muirbacterium halophilum]
MADKNNIEDLLKDNKVNKKDSDDELAILRIFNSDDKDNDSIIIEEPEVKEDIELVLDDGESLFIDEEEIVDEKFKLNLNDNDILSDISPIESPVEVMIESKIEKNDILEEFLKKENQQGLSVEEKKEIVEEDDDDFYVKSYKDESKNKDIHKVKNLIDSFLELFISKNGKSFHVSSKGELFFILNQGKVEKEINKEFNYKSLNSFIDYICSRVEMESLDENGILKKIYNYRKKSFRFYMLKDYKSISLSFEFIEDIYDSIFKITEDIPFNLMFSPYRGAINIISGFKPEYAQMLCSIILEKYISAEKNVILLYEDDSFVYNTSSFNFSSIRLDDDRKHVMNSVVEIDSIIIIYASVKDKFIKKALELAYSGKNVFFITAGKNSCGDIIEFFLYNIIDVDKRRIFSKYINSVVSLGLMKKGANVILPVYDFLYIDRKLKRNLFESKMDVFFRGINEDSGDKIIRFDKVLNNYVQKNLIKTVEAEDFVRSFSWTIE